MYNQKKEIKIVSIPTFILSVLSWAFVPTDLSILKNEFFLKVILVIIIISVGMSILLVRWLNNTKKQLNESQLENDETRRVFHSENEELKSIISQERSKYSTLELSTTRAIDQLNSDIKSKENKYFSEIAQRDGQIKNLNEQIKFKDDEIQKLNDKITELNTLFEKTEEKIIKDKKIIEKSQMKIKMELSSAKEEIAILKNSNSFEHFSTWRHTVLIVDDKETIISFIRKRLEDIPCDIVYLKRLEDFRLVENFEIIISDILKCSPGNNATLMLNTIKEKYPYKFVFAMSTTPAECEGLKIDGDIIEKDSMGVQYIKIIKQTIMDCIHRLDEPKEYWESLLETSLLKYSKRPKKLETIKNSYISCLRRLAQTPN